MDYIFDFGGVVANINKWRLRRRLMGLGISLLTQIRHVRELKRIAYKFINGLDDEREALHELYAFCRKDIPIEKVWSSFDDFCDDVPLSRLARIAELRRSGSRVFVLSNITQRIWQHASQCLERLGHPVSQTFDGLFLSFQTQIPKPHAQAFLNLIEKTGIVPANTTFLDDNEDNINTARSLGFQTVLVPFNKLEKVFPVTIDR